MNIKIFITVFFILICYVSFSQKGYLGRKNYIGITGMFNVPVFSGAFNEKAFYNVRGEMKKKKDWFDFGATIEYYRIVKKRLGIGVEITNRRFEVLSDKSYANSFYDDVFGNYVQKTGLRLEPVKLNYFAFIPQFVVAPKMNHVGTGISHKIGIGYSLSKVRNTSHYYSINEFSETNSENQNWTPSDKYYLDQNWKSFEAITLMYGLSLDVPITDLIHVYGGFNYYLNLYLRPSEEYLNNNSEDFFSFSDIYFNVQRENLFNWNAKIGVAIVF